MKNLQSRSFPAVFVALLAVCALPISAMATTIKVESTPKPTPKPTPDTRGKRISLSRDSVHNDSIPRHPVNQIVGQVIDRVVYRLLELKKGPTAGAPAKSYKETEEEEVCTYFCNPSAYIEYYYLDSDDDRVADFDTRSHSVSGGFDFTTIGDLLVGVIYSYTHGETISEFFRSRTSTDSHFGNIYVAKSLTDFLSVGVTGGYGHTDAKTRLWRPKNLSSSDSDSWTASPFVTLSYVKDAFSASFTTSYLYSHTASVDTGKLTFSLNCGYDVTDWLTLEAKGKYTQTIHDEADELGQDDHWFGVGTKATFRITTKLSIYAAYDFEFNDDFQDNTVTGGLSYSF